MASDAGEIFDEHGGDAMAIAELLVQEQRTTARLQMELDEARRERAGMQYLAQKNRAAIQRARARRGRIEREDGTAYCDWCQDAWEEPYEWPCPIIRDLDGDTTEEQR